MRYDGTDNASDLGLDPDDCIGLCPEVEGGLSIPREAAEIIGGSGEQVLKGLAKVKTKSGKDVTQEFISGARKALDLCQKLGIDKAILAKNSPSCGVNKIYDGSFSKSKIPGMGVCAALLNKNGIKVNET